MTTRGRSAWALFATTLLLSSAARAQDPRRGDVRGAMAGFMRALNALDVDSMSLYFADDVTAFVPVVQAERVEGKEALVKIFRAFVEHTRPAVARLRLVPEDLEVVEEPTLAMVSFNVRDQGPVLVRRRTFLWQLIEGRWQIRHMHASDLTSPRAPERR